MKSIFVRGFLPLLAVAFLSLALAGCGDATPTTVPATTAAMAAKPTDSAMMKPTDSAMMAKPTDSAMMKPTDSAMMAKPTDSAMMKPTDSAMMAKPTDSAMMKPTDSAMTKPTRLVGTFNNQGAEPVAGKVTLGKTTDGKLILRLENLKSANGPDLYVFLTKETSPSADGQIKAGYEVSKLKATDGNQNYELDAKLDLSQYKSVAVYCKSFSVIFGYANLSNDVS